MPQAWSISYQVLENFVRKQRTRLALQNAAGSYNVVLVLPDEDKLIHIVVFYGLALIPSSK